MERMARADRFLFEMSRYNAGPMSDAKFHTVMSGTRCTLQITLRVARAVV